MCIRDSTNWICVKKWLIHLVWQVDPCRTAHLQCDFEWYILQGIPVSLSHLRLEWTNFLAILVSSKTKTCKRITVQVIFKSGKQYNRMYSTVLNKRSYSNNHSYPNLPTKSIIVATGISIPSGKKLDTNFWTAETY